MKKAFVTTLALVIGSGFLLNSAKAQAPTQQEIADLAVKHNDAMVANREKLKTVSSNYRVEIWKNGQLQWVDLVNVQIAGPDQKPVLTQVNRDQVVPEERGLFSKGEQKDEFKELNQITEYVFPWIIYYNRLPTDRILTLFNQAVRTGNHQFAPYSTDVLGVWGTNIRDSNANDKVTIWFNKKNGHPSRTAFVVPVQKSPDGATGETISGIINYRYLQDGSAFYPDHIDVEIPARQVKIKVEHLATQKKL